MSEIREVEERAFVKRVLAENSALIIEALNCSGSLAYPPKPFARTPGALPADMCLWNGA